jgi:hypothetical protein
LVDRPTKIGAGVACASGNPSQIFLHLARRQLYSAKPSQVKSAFLILKKVLFSVKIVYRMGKDTSKRRESENLRVARQRNWKMLSKIVQCMLAAAKFLT